MSTEKSSNLPMENNTEVRWDYEAPQYCDFESINTFEADPENDKFFMKDHEKENSTDCDSDFFQTPMKPQDLDFGDYGNRDSMSEYFSLSTGQNNNKTPMGRKSDYSLRATPLREACLSGQKPLKETRLSYHFGGARKSRKSMSARKSNVNKLTLASVENTLVVDGIDDLGKRETYDLSTIEQAIEEINSTLDATNDVTISEVNTDNKIDANEAQAESVAHGDAQTKPEENGTQEESITSMDADNLMSEDEDDNKEEFASTSAEKMIEQEPVKAETSMRRSSYVVTSPVVAKAAPQVRFNSSRLVVSFAEDSETTVEAESKVTPQDTSKANAKIRTRKSTPAAVNVPARFKKFIEHRLSKTSTPESVGSVKTDPSTSQETTSGDAVPKKGVRFQVGDEKKPPVANKRTTAASASVTNKRTTAASAPVSNKRTTVASASNRSVMRLAGRKSENTTGLEKKPAVKRTSYHSMAEMQSTVLLRHFSPAKKQASAQSQTPAKPTLTKPRGPKLLTEQRAQQHLAARRQTMACVSEQVDGGKENVAQVARPQVAKPVPWRARPPVVTHLAKKKSKPTTKAITPVFLTDIRLKQYNHKQKANGDNKTGDVAPVVRTFKARPAPNFKRVEYPGKLVSSGKRTTIVVKPFSFEQREKDKKEKAACKLTAASSTN